MHLFYAIAEKTFENSDWEEINEDPLGVAPGRVCAFPRTLISDCFTVLWIEESWALELEIYFEKLDFQSIELIVPNSSFYSPLGCYKVISVFLTTSAFSLSLGPVKTSYIVS